MEEKPGTVDISNQSHHSDNITGIIHPLADLPRLPQNIVNSVGSGRNRVTNSAWTSGPSMMFVSCTLILISKGFFPIRYGLFKTGKARHFLKVTGFFLLHSDCPYSCAFYYPITVIRLNISSSQQCRR